VITVPSEVSVSTLHVPHIIERSPSGERSYDIFSRLLMDRIVFLGSAVDDDVANVLIAQLLFLEADAPGRDIQLYVNSPGGIVQAGLAIYDTMQHLTSPVCTTCVGMAASMGCFLLAAGKKGRRAALPHARIMMHQPSQSGGGGSASDIEIQAKEIVYGRAKLFELLGKHTGQPLERIEREFERDHWFSAAEAKRYGLIDVVIEDSGALGAAAAIARSDSE
jgi:ATP-dependent Clp protease protease subunit